MMETRRKSLSDVPEASTLPAILERSPLLDRRALRSSSSGSNSVSVFHLQKQNSRGSSRSPLKTITERPQPSISRSRSAPFHRSRYATSPLTTFYPLHRSATPDHAQFRSSPQYRVNPVVRFDERLLPERMNYGIAGYNTSRPRSEATQARKGVVVRIRPRSVRILRLWTRRLRVRLIRIRVRSACSRLMMRFRRRR